MLFRSADGVLLASGRSAVLSNTFVLAALLVCDRRPWLTALFFGLEIAIFPLFFVFVYRIRAWQGVRRGMFGLKRSSLRWREMLPYFPTWVPPLFGLLFGYAIVNFLLAISHLPPKGATGPLTAAQALYTVRAFSGHWLMFYSLPTLFFLFVPADARPHAESREAALR